MVLQLVLELHQIVQMLDQVLMLSQVVAVDLLLILTLTLTLPQLDKLYNQRQELFHSLLQVNHQTPLTLELDQIVELQVMVVLIQAQAQVLEQHQLLVTQMDQDQDLVQMYLEREQ